MSVRIDTTARRLEYVTSIAIQIGDEQVSHHFGRRVTMSHARKWAQHYLDVFTGEPSSFTANAAAGDKA